jgi:asparagine synthase (glutamine-hydrolysing)
VADKLSATLHPVALGADDLVTDLADMVRANEGPVESPSTLAQYCVMREARHAGITVLLDGQGADETWAGYDKYARTALTNYLARLAPRRASHLASSWQRVRGQRLRPEVAQFAVLAGGDAGRRLLERMRRRATAQWLAPAYVRCSFDDPLQGLERRRTGQAPSDLALADLTRITLPRLLRYADRDSMAWSREVRLPFLDHRLVELAARTPFERKVVDGWTKEPVRRMLDRLGLPDIARRRDKRAYMPPTARWLADPRIDARVAEAWSRLRHDGIVGASEPSSATLPRWRVLTVATWADEFGVSLG